MFLSGTIIYNNFPQHKIVIKAVENRGSLTCLQTKKDNFVCQEPGVRSQEPGANYNVRQDNNEGS